MTDRTPEPDTSTEAAEVLALLQEESDAKMRSAWARRDGGQEWCISSALCDRAAALIERLVAERDEARARTGRRSAPRSICSTARRTDP